MPTTTITAALRSFFGANLDIAGVVDDRIFSDDPPGVDAEESDIGELQESLDDYPCLTIVQNSTRVMSYLNGQVGMRVALLKVSAYAKTRSQANHLIELVQQSGLTRLKGNCGGVNVLSAILQDGVATDTHWIKHLGKNARVCESGVFFEVTHEAFAE